MAATCNFRATVANVATVFDANFLQLSEILLLQHATFVQLLQMLQAPSKPYFCNGICNICNPPPLGGVASVACCKRCSPRFVAATWQIVPSKKMFFEKLAELAEEEK